MKIRLTDRTRQPLDAVRRLVSGITLSFSWVTGNDIVISFDDQLELMYVTDGKTPVLEILEVISPEELKMMIENVCDPTLRNNNDLIKVSDLAYGFSWAEARGRARNCHRAWGDIHYELQKAFD